MTANQRRQGFRLPWSSEEQAAREAAQGAVDSTASAEAGEAPNAPASGAAQEPAQQAAPTQRASSARTDAPATPDATPSPDFMRDLVSAMRSVADEARQSGVSEARAAADEQVRRLEADSDRRRDDLRSRAETDEAGIGEWAQAEAERIKAEAEQRVVARRGQLDQQLSAEATRVEAETKALRDRVAEYERELDAYHAQLTEIGDPAAFAAAAKRMPRPPVLESRSSAATPAAARPAPPSEATASPQAEESAQAVTVAAPAVTQPPSTEPTVAEATEAVAAAPAEQTDTNGVSPDTDEAHPAQDEVLAGRLAELDASLAGTEAAAPAPAGEPTTTEIVVSGLGSFGAITGFRQALAGVDGIEGVALSLGQTGEFIFRATHATGFDVAAAITALEGESASITPRPDGGLHVTLERGR